MIARRPVLRDPELDRRLERDGFVVTQLLPARAARRLRDGFVARVPDGGSGFVSDLYVTDREYRRWASASLAAALDRPAGELFCDYEPFLRHHLAEPPGTGGGLVARPDWMWVDESSGVRSFTLWLALEDVTGHNGQLRVLRGSHRLDNSPRGTGLVAPWLGQTDVIEPRLLTVPVRAGDCVVFDHALVRASYPNHTTQPRVVAAIGLKPVPEPVVHFRARGDGRADVFVLEPSELVELTPSDLLSRADPPDRVVPAPPSPLTGEEAGRRLDAGVQGGLDRARRTVSAALGAAGSAAQHLQDRALEFGRREPAGSLATERTAPPGRLAALLRPGAAGLTRPDAPAADAPLRERLKAQVDDLPTKAAIAVLGLNEASIRRFGPDTPAVWDPARFEWARRIEAGYPEIRAEVDDLLHGPTEIPHIEDVTGGIPQGNIGPWRSFVLMHQGRWMDWNCDRCPRTTELVRSIPGLTMAGFSVLEPGTHITEHRGPNKGALRYQLGVVVPGDYGDCRIRVGEDMLVWQEGEGVMFDFTVPHEAWNDSDGIRVLLMLEVITPGLPWYLRHTNAAAQRAMGWFPTTRDMTARLRRLEPQLARTGTGSDGVRR